MDAPQPEIPTAIAEPAYPASADKGAPIPRWATAVLLLLILGALAAYGATLLAPVYAGTRGSDFAQFYYPAARLFVAGATPTRSPSMSNPRLCSSSSPR